LPCILNSPISSRAEQSNSAKRRYDATVMDPVNPRLPVIFFGHGNPMNALGNNDYTRAWAAVGSSAAAARGAVHFGALVRPAARRHGNGVAADDS
jgi:hypothetical protein